MSGSVSKVKMLCGSLCHHIHHYASPKVQQTVCNLALNQLQYGQLTHLAAPGINYKSQIKDVFIYFIFYVHHFYLSDLDSCWFHNLPFCPNCRPRLFKHALISANESLVIPYMRHHNWAVLLFSYWGGCRRS